MQKEDINRLICQATELDLDFCSSLDAMHEAEKAIPDRNLYRKFLFLVVLEDPTNAANEPAFATAAQRAEALLRTLNLWTDEA